MSVDGLSNDDLRNRGLDPNDVKLVKTGNGFSRVVYVRVNRKVYHFCKCDDWKNIKRVQRKREHINGFDVTREQYFNDRLRYKADIESSSDSVYESAESDDTSRCVNDLIEKRPPAEQAILNCIKQGMTDRDSAALLGVPLSTYNWRKNNLIKRLQNLPEWRELWYR